LVNIENLILDKSGRMIIMEIINKVGLPYAI